MCTRAVVSEFDTAIGVFRAPHDRGIRRATTAVIHERAVRKRVPTVNSSIVRRSSTNSRVTKRNETNTAAFTIPSCSAIFRIRRISRSRNERRRNYGTIVHKLENPFRTRSDARGRNAVKIYGRRYHYGGNQSTAFGNCVSRIFAVTGPRDYSFSGPPVNVADKPRRTIYREKLITDRAEISI